MKKLVLIAALAAATAAHAEDALIYPFNGMKVGETIENPFPTVLYLQKKCELPLVNAKDMRAYASYRGVWDIGCWGQTIDGQALVIVPNLPPNSMPLSVLAKADVQKDGRIMTIKALPTYGR